MGTWAQPSDVNGRWLLPPHGLTDEELEVWIGDAEDEILNRVPDIQARIDSTKLPTKRVKRIVAAMVIRVISNPERLRQRTSVTGPMTEGKTIAGANPGGLTLEDDELASLLGRTSSKGRAFTISTTAGMP